MVAHNSNKKDKNRPNDTEQNVMTAKKNLKYKNNGKAFSYHYKINHTQQAQRTKFTLIASIFFFLISAGE